MKEHHTFLPTSAKEMKLRGWQQADIILFSGDAYIDHPAFGIAILARIAEDKGFKVAVVPQPNWRDDLRDFKKLGRPKYFFGVSSGVMDSMVNHYTANKRLRSDDAYTPDNKAGMRPDYAAYVYTNILKTLYPDVPIIVGGVEASMRRFCHYDYWSDKLKPPFLIEAAADMLLYGMAEKSFIELLDYIRHYDCMPSPEQLKQCCFASDDYIADENTIELPSYEDCLHSKEKFAEAFVLIEKESNKLQQERKIIQRAGNKWIVATPPYSTISTVDLDYIYDLPYTRLPHPRYKGKEIKAYESVKNSVTIHRGCFGGCSFCAIAMHQGKFVSSRSEQSILNELNKIAANKDFKGTITDLGGPSANMYQMQGKNLQLCLKCNRPSCIFPDICKNLEYSHKTLLQLYKKARFVQGIKHIYIGSGIRHDMLVLRSKEETQRFGLDDYIETLVKHHVSGRLKVAPEHSSEAVLKAMRKNSFEHFLAFREKFYAVAHKYNRNLQLIPYLISGHPACKEADMAHLAKQLIKLNFKPEQVQDFTPTPMTLSSVMYYTGFDPYSGKKTETAKSLVEREIQHRYLFWYKPENRNWIKKKLKTD